MSRTTPLTVSLPDPLDDSVRERAASGRVAPAADLIRTAVEDLARRERARAIIADLNCEIELGARQAEAGQLEDGESVLRRIREGRTTR